MASSEGQIGGEDFVLLTHDKLCVDTCSQMAGADCAGAISLFVGTTRDNFEGKTVLRLEYEAYEEMAQKEMQKLCATTRERFPVHHVVMHHRLGVVPVCQKITNLCTANLMHFHSL